MSKAKGGQLLSQLCIMLLQALCAVDISIEHNIRHLDCAVEISIKHSMCHLDCAIVWLLSLTHTEVASTTQISVVLTHASSTWKKCMDYLLILSLKTPIVYRQFVADKTSISQPSFLSLMQQTGR